MDYVSHILGIIIPTDYSNIFFRGVGILPTRQKKTVGEFKVALCCVPFED